MPRPPHQMVLLKVLRGYDLGVNSLRLRLLLLLCLLEKISIEHDGILVILISAVRFLEIDEADHSDILAIQASLVGQPDAPMNEVRALRLYLHQPLEVVPCEHLIDVLINNLRHLTFKNINLLVVISILIFMQILVHSYLEIRIVVEHSTRLIKSN